MSAGGLKSKKKKADQAFESKLKHKILLSCMQEQKSRETENKGKDSSAAECCNDFHTTFEQPCTPMNSESKINRILSTSSFFTLSFALKGFCNSRLPGKTKQINSIGNRSTLHAH